METAMQLEKARELINDAQRAELIRLFNIKDKLIGYATDISRKLISNPDKIRRIDFEDLISDVILKCIDDNKVEKKDVNHLIYVHIGQEIGRQSQLRNLDWVGKKIYRNAINDAQCFTCKEILPFAFFPYYKSKSKSTLTVRSRCIYCIRKTEVKRREKTVVEKRMRDKKDYDAKYKDLYKLKRKLLREKNTAEGKTPTGKPLTYINYPGEFKIVFEHYKVYQDGTIIRQPTGSYLSEAFVRQEKTVTKGIRVSLNKGIDHYIHDLVARCWHPEWYEGCKVIHQDGDKYNNRIGNLEIVSAKHQIEETRTPSRRKGKAVWTYDRRSRLE
jgi:hypothetical protein